MATTTEGDIVNDELNESIEIPSDAVSPDDQIDVLTSPSAATNANASSAVDDDDNDGDVGKQEDSGKVTRRPDNVAIKQQRMKSWQPLLDPKWVIGVYLLIGAAFIPTGESSVPCIVCAAAVASGVGR